MFNPLAMFKRFSVLGRLHRGDTFSSLEEKLEFERRLADLLARGRVERVPVGQMLSYANPEEWYRDRRTGAVYRYVPPDPPFRGYFGPVRDPDRRSYFESLCAGEYPTREEYEALKRRLDMAIDAGEVECALPVGEGVPGRAVFLHRKTGETFGLTPPLRELGDRAMWVKYHYYEPNRWPGQAVPGPPPWRRERQGEG